MKERLKAHRMDIRFDCINKPSSSIISHDQANHSNAQVRDDFPFPCYATPFLPSDMQPAMQMQHTQPPKIVKPWYHNPQRLANAHFAKW